MLTDRPSAIDPGNVGAKIVVMNGLLLVRRDTEGLQVRGVERVSESPQRTGTIIQSEHQDLPPETRVVLQPLAGTQVTVDGQVLWMYRRENIQAMLT